MTQGANLNTAVGWCSFSELSLVGIKGLENAVHEGPSSIGVDTLELTAADLAKDPSDQAAVEIFLEGAGVPNEYISFFRSRIGQPVQFYSAFISYSRKDEGFADRLYADLRQKNIRCWRDKEDLKIGEKLRQSINDAIRLHEKLIVVLSENSVNSIWVEDEVEMAFEKERRQGGTVLFPIRLDNAVMHSKAGWAAKVRTRHIGDFRTWEDHDHYQKSLARLIRDLQADDKMKPASI